jgi:hypothetical protein
VTENTDEPTGRAKALDRLRSGFATVADQMSLLDEAESDRDRRSLLLALTTAAWELRDRATQAYEALQREGEQDGLTQGVLE